MIYARSEYYKNIEGGGSNRETSAVIYQALIFLLARAECDHQMHAVNLAEIPGSKE